MKYLVLTPVLTLLLCGCARKPAETTETGIPPDQPTAAQPVVPVQTAPGMPETRGDAVWQYLDSQNFEKNWKLMPGTKPYYKGADPHGALLTTYVNQTAADAMGNNTTTLPNGSVIVKQNYTPDRKLAATTVMYKVSGYDAKNQDWFWLKRDAAGKIEGEGKLTGCQDCHRNAPGNDYIFSEAKM